MSKWTPPKTPPRPPNPDIFLKWWSLTSSPDIYFSLYLIFFLPPPFLILVIVGGIDEMIEWDGEDEE
jgi:hypothetical protein